MKMNPQPNPAREVEVEYLFGGYVEGVCEQILCWYDCYLICYVIEGRSQNLG